MKMKFLAAVMTAVLSISLCACGGSAAADPEDVADEVIAACDEFSLDSVKAAEAAIKAYIKAKEKAEEEEREKEEEEEESEEDEDPGNADSTEDTGMDQSVDAMTAKYVGVWELQGIIQSDGNLDTETGAACKYVFKADHTYTATGTDVSGSKIDESGNWALNGKKQLVAGKYTLGIDESGYLLKDTGERDGKGRKMKYAFSKTS